MTKKDKVDRIAYLIAELNSIRIAKGLSPVTREWTGCGHWLKEPTSTHYISMGKIFTQDYEFIGFLEGLIYGYDHA